MRLLVSCVWILSWSTLLSLLRGWRNSILKSFPSFQELCFFYFLFSLCLLGTFLFLSALFFPPHALRVSISFRLSGSKRSDRSNRIFLRLTISILLLSHMFHCSLSRHSDSLPHIASLTILVLCAWNPHVLITPAILTVLSHCLSVGSFSFKQTQIKTQLQVSESISLSVRCLYSFTSSHTRIPFRILSHTLIASSRIFLHVVLSLLFVYVTAFSCPVYLSELFINFHNGIFSAILYCSIILPVELLFLSSPFASLFCIVFFSAISVLPHSLSYVG